MRHEDPRLDLLLDRYIENVLTQAESEELNSLLLASNAARLRFWQVGRLHALAREWGTVAAGEQGTARSISAVKTYRPRRLSHKMGTVLALAAALAGVLLLSHLLESRAKKSHESRDRHAASIESVAVSAPAAILTHSVDAAWGGTIRPSPASGLAPGRIELLRGAIQIDFLSGAHVIVEGPAEFEVVSENSARCWNGRFSARIPEQARGFELSLPSLVITDLGTAFGCEFGKDGIADIQVIEGRIALKSSNGRTRESSEGQGVRFSNGEFEPIAFDSSKFLFPEHLAERAKNEARKQMSAWRNSVDLLKADPSTLVYYTFETDSPWSGILNNQVANAAPSTNGAIVGATWSEGRWPGKGALEFKGAGDRVRLGVAGSFPVATCMTWIRADNLPNKVNSILSAVQGGQGAAMWELTQSGELAFRVRVERRPDRPHFAGKKSSTAVSPISFGQWLHVAIIYDANAGTISHFIDGSLYAIQKPNRVTPLSFLKLEVANWRLPNNSDEWWPKDRPVPQRNFVGRMDELVLSSRALSPDEIRAHYESGKP